MSGWSERVRQATNPRRVGAAGVLLCALAAGGQNSGPQERRPAPIERRPPANANSNQVAPRGQQPAYRQNYQTNQIPIQQQQRQQLQQRQQAQQHKRAETAGQRHLGEWLEQHQGLSLTQQQQALDREPGFTKLQPQVQQRMNQRLQQLNTMTPARRDRAIERIEAMERLSPGQRQEVRGAMRQLGSLPPDRRRAVAQSFHMLQGMPPQQREQYLNSPQIRAQFNDQERGTLGNLVRVAPLLPLQQGPAR